MTRELWRDVDAWISERLVRGDSALDDCLRASAEAGLPQIAVSAAQGKLLHLMALSIGARRILEIGTLGGYSTIWLARALPPGGEVVTLEIEPRHAEVARGSMARAGLADRVDVRVGPALDLLPELEGQFDFSFIDADKESNAEYFDHAVRLSRPGAVIVVDNVVRDGKVLDAGAGSQVQGVRRMMDAIAHDDRVAATAVQTVGDKGYDGFLMAVVR